MSTSSNHSPKLPEVICFRITRNCNARCRFCLAPPEGDQPSETTLKRRIDWLLAHGVKIIHFCGGEPTIHPALTELLSYVQRQGGKSRLTTNAIAISEKLLSRLRATNTEVKVSLHGDQDHHNAILGVTSFQHTINNIKRLLTAGIRTSIQTTIVAGQSEAIDWVIDYCLQNGIKRLSLLPFIPRGNGNNCRDEFSLTAQQRRALRDQIKKRRHTLNGRLDLRWLDFSAHTLHVVEANGDIILEAATETMDKKLCRIPDANTDLSKAEYLVD